MTDADAFLPADLIDVLDTRLSEADAARLVRVLRALADAGLIRECHLFVRAGELGGASHTSATRGSTG